MDLHYPPARICLHLRLLSFDKKRATDITIGKMTARGVREIYDYYNTQEFRQTVCSTPNWSINIHL